MEQLKKALIDNFKEKGTTCTLTYTGDTTDINSNIQNAVTNASHDSDALFLLSNYSYSFDQASGNLLITFTFVYNTNEYIGISPTLKDLKTCLIEEMNDRNEDINVIFKEAITNNDVLNILNEIMSEDSYLKKSINEYSYLVQSSYGRYGVSLTINYETTKEQEEFVDKTVDFLVFNLTDYITNDHEKVKLIHDYILSKVTYSSDKTYRNAYDALYYGETVCEGYAMLTYKMLKAAGIDNEIVSNDDHAWNIVKIDGNWYHLDTTWNDGERKDEGFYKFYNMTDEELLQTRSYTNTSGIVCPSNYISDLEALNANSEGKYDALLADLQKTITYMPINIFKSNSTLNLLYNEVVLKEGEQISLINKNIPEGFYDNAYAWRSSDPDIAEVTNGVITAKKPGKVTISAVQTYLFDFKHNLFATVDVVSQEPQDGNTAQALSQSNMIGFTDPDVVPQITISSKEDINATTTVTNCFDVLDGTIEMIGQPIDVQTTSDFEWAEISFTLSQEQLNSIDINELVIYWYDDENGAIIPQATKIDASTGKVSAVVTHFSKYFLSYFCIQNETVNIAFVIDSYYGDQASLDIYKTNITNTILDLRKNVNVKIVFVDNNEENPNKIKKLYFRRIENPTTKQNNKVIESISEVFNNIEPLENTLKPGIIEESTEALRKGRQIIRNRNIVSNILGIKPKTYALHYTKWSVVFHDNESIVLDMKDTIGLVVGGITAYYEDQPIAYDESNVQPLVEFLLRGDHSNIGIEKTGKKIWKIKLGEENNVDDVTVLQKVLINKGFLERQTDASGNSLPFGTYDIASRNAVMQYQVTNGMTPDGIVDQNEWLSLSLPWDDQNKEPSRNNSKYMGILNNNEYDCDPPTIVLENPDDGDTFNIGDTILIEASGTNCNLIQLFVNGKQITSGHGSRRFGYSYVIDSIGELNIQVRASNTSSPYVGETAVSDIVKVKVNEVYHYEKIEDIEPLDPGYYELFVEDLVSKFVTNVYVYVTNPATEKITFSIGKENQHETVSQIAGVSSLKPKVAMNAGFFDMCQYYDKDYPQWGKKKGEMQIDNNDVEHHGVLIIDGEELETVSMIRKVEVVNDKEVFSEREVYEKRVEEANTFIKWKKKEKGRYDGPAEVDTAENKLVWEDGGTEISQITKENIEYIKENAEWAIGAGYILIDGEKNGLKSDKRKVNNWYSGSTPWKPRTMLGVKENGEFILAVIEGGIDENSNKGASRKEQKEVMEELGAIMAINFDGGGSSTFWKDGEGNKYSAEERRIGSIVMVVNK